MPPLLLPVMPPLLLPVKPPLLLPVMPPLLLPVMPPLLLPVMPPLLLPVKPPLLLDVLCEPLSSPLLSSPEFVDPPHAAASATARDATINTRILFIENSSLESVRVCRRVMPITRFGVPRANRVRLLFCANADFARFLIWASGVKVPHAGE
jgi:hypothetical protein